MSILVINVGSSSLKYRLFDESSEKVLKEGDLGHSGDRGLERIVKTILRGIENVGAIAMVINRIVHGGPHPDATQELSFSILDDLERWNFLAPLHNPPAIAAARLFLDYLPGVKQVAVYDSGFFRDLPKLARLYALLAEVRKRYSIERIGFHGISHEYACREACKKIKKPFEKANLISFHLGGGSSACVVSRGKPLDTSMGFTPLEGLPMMTRSGDLDPGIVLFLLKKFVEDGHAYPLPNDVGAQHIAPLQNAVEYLEHILNEESGLKGLSGKESFLEILRDYQFDERSKFAYDFFVYHIRKYIGSYLAVAPVKPDAIVFTGEIGAGEASLRKNVMKDLWVAKGLKVVVVPPDEELAMMRKIKENPKS